MARSSHPSAGREGYLTAGNQSRLGSSAEAKSALSGRKAGSLHPCRINADSNSAPAVFCLRRAYPSLVRRNPHRLARLQLRPTNPAKKTSVSTSWRRDKSYQRPGTLPAPRSEFFGILDTLNRYSSDLSVRLFGVPGNHNLSSHGLNPRPVCRSRRRTDYEWPLLRSPQP